MRQLHHRAVVVAFAVAGTACAHRPPAPSQPLATVVWPAPPAEPRIRLAAISPDPAAPPPRRSFFRAALDMLAGVDRSARTADALLVRPFGVTASPDGSFLVADPDRPGVLRFRPDGGHEFLACHGRPWVAPMAAVPGMAGEIWIADGGAGEIVRFEGGSCRALGASALERPTGIAVLEGQLLVVDPPRHAVVVLSPEGEELGRWGSRGDGDGQLHFPTAIARAPDGSVLVVDALNFRIARFSQDGRWRGAFGEVARPKGIAVDGEGRVYVSDAQRDLVLRFTPDGVLEAELGGGGGEAGYFTLPAGLSSARGRLYVADSHNQRIQVFEILGERP